MIFSITLDTTRQHGNTGIAANRQNRTPCHNVLKKEDQQVTMKNIAECDTGCGNFQAYAKNILKLKICHFFFGLLWWLQSHHISSKVFKTSLVYLIFSTHCSSEMLKPVYENQSFLIIERNFVGIHLAIYQNSISLSPGYSRASKDQKSACHNNTFTVDFFLLNSLFTVQLLCLRIWLCYNLSHTNLIHLGRKCLPWVACLRSKMPMFQRAGMKEGGLPLSPTLQYLILMT